MLLSESKRELIECVESSQNEMLKLLEEKVLDKYKSDSDFRGMIMVNRRLFADRLQVISNSVTFTEVRNLNWTETLAPFQLYNWMFNWN